MAKPLSLVSCGSYWINLANVVFVIVHAAADVEIHTLPGASLALTGEDAAALLEVLAGQDVLEQFGMYWINLANVVYVSGDASACAVRVVSGANIPLTGEDAAAFMALLEKQA